MGPLNEQETDYNSALATFDSCKTRNMEWKGQDDGTFWIKRPDNFFTDKYGAQWFVKRAEFLARGKPYTVQENVSFGTNKYIVFSGKGASYIARAVRDNLQKSFQGSENIPFTREGALDVFSDCLKGRLTWTPQRELHIILPINIDRNNLLGYYRTYYKHAGARAAMVLANGKPLQILEVKKGGENCQILSGEGAAEVALALKNDLHKEFAGSASIPGGGSARVA